MKNYLIENKIYIFLILFISLFFICCWEFSSIKQPEIADPNSSFDVPITVALTPTMRPPDQNGVGYFGIRLPIGWTVDDSIHYQGILDGTFIFSKEHSDSMEIYESSPKGYYWWVGVCDSVDSLPEGNISLAPRITTDSQSGTFFIDYMLSDRIESFGDYVVHSGPYPISAGLAMSTTVTNTNDSGEGSLRRAIEEVSMNGKILFDLTYPSTIVLESQLVIDRSITIAGPENEDLIISGNNNDRVIFINERLNINISNLTITNGYTSDDGGGIYCESSNLNLHNVTFSNNSSDNSGGGIAYSNGQDNILKITNSVFHKNNAHRGGGVACEDAIITNSVFTKNYADLGGGISCGDAILTNVTITENNSIEKGGGLFSDPGEISIRNSILWNNSPENIFIYNASIQAVYSNIQGGIIGKDIFDTDPLFADTLNYYLSENSPCIDSGDPDTLFNDWEDSANPGSALRPALGSVRNDMGAYGGHGRFKIIPLDTNESQFDFQLDVFESVDFLNRDIGWICGQDWIYKTINGGQSWELNPLNENVKIVDFVNESIGWLIGENSNQNPAVLKSVDGGDKWSIQKSFPWDYWFTSLSAVNNEVIYMTASITYCNNLPCGRIIKTMDGGSNWIDLTQDNFGDIWSVSFLNSDSGVVSGEIEGKGCILRTYDGGLTWDDVYCGSESIYNLKFIDDATCFFQEGDWGEGRILLKTNDKFKSCQKILGGGVSYSVIDKDTIFALTGLQRFLKSTDGGNNWEGTHLGRPFSIIKFVDNSTGWIFGDGKIFTTNDGGITWLDISSASVTGIKQDDKDSRQLPIQFKLSQNYPNPFNPLTTIIYKLPKASVVELNIYNILGQKISTLVSTKQPAGTYKVEWNASSFSSGVYYYRIEAGKFQDVKKMILLR